jgi:hypothetical protein
MTSPPKVYVYVRCHLNCMCACIYRLQSPITKDMDARYFFACPQGSFAITSCPLSIVRVRLRAIMYAFLFSGQNKPSLCFFLSFCGVCFFFNWFLYCVLRVFGTCVYACLCTYQRFSWGKRVFATCFSTNIFHFHACC